MPKEKNVEMTFNPIDYAAILGAFENAVPNIEPGFPGFMNVNMHLANAQNLYSAVVGAISLEEKPPLPPNLFI